MHFILLKLWNKFRHDNKILHIVVSPHHHTFLLLSTTHYFNISRNSTSLVVGRVALEPGPVFKFCSSNEVYCLASDKPRFLPPLPQGGCGENKAKKSNLHHLEQLEGALLQRPHCNALQIEAQGTDLGHKHVVVHVGRDVAANWTSVFCSPRKHSS